MQRIEQPNRSEDRQGQRKYNLEECPQLPAPSIVEASISAGGTLIWKYVFIISTLNGDSSIGTTSAQIEFLRSSTWV